MKNIEAPFMRTPYNYDRDAASRETGLTCKDPSLAQQQFKEETDINTIVERFHLTGEMPHVEKLPTYDDFTGIFNYQDAMNAIVAARETFMQYPANIRSQFDNDPAKFVEFCSDEKNRDRIIEMGLATPGAETSLQKTTKELESLKSAQKAPQSLLIEADKDKPDGGKPRPAKPDKP